MRALHIRRRVRAIHIGRLLYHRTPIGAACIQMTVHEDHGEDKSDDHAGDGADDDAR